MASTMGSVGSGPDNRRVAIKDEAYEPVRAMFKAIGQPQFAETAGQ